MNLYAFTFHHSHRDPGEPCWGTMAAFESSTAATAYAIERVASWKRNNVLAPFPLGVFWRVWLVGGGLVHEFPDPRDVPSPGRRP